MAVRGPRRMRPAVPFMPPSPQKPAGMRIEPPPSPPVARVSRPPATAAAEPADDPPVVLVGSHGLAVIPCRRVTLTLSPPNSLAVVWPASTAPAARSRSMTVASWPETRSAKARDASVRGQPATGSSSLTAMGSPPRGAFTSARAAAARALSPSRWVKALSVLVPMAARVASSSSAGERSPVRKASTSEQASSDQGASAMGVTLGEGAVPAYSPREAGRALGRLARADGGHAVPVLGGQGGIHLQPPLLVGGQAVAAPDAFREGGQLAGQLEGGGQGLTGLGDAVGEPHGQRLVGPDGPAREHEVEGPAGADEAGQGHGSGVRH